MKLFYIILGASVKGRTIEQHDVFFGIGKKLKDLVPYIKDFWPEAGSDLHLDAYQEVKFVDGYEIKIVEKGIHKSDNHLFFINLGAVSHIDDKHGVDVDDIFKVNDLLPHEMKEKYTLVLEKSGEVEQKNFIKLKYLKIDKI